MVKTTIKFKFRNFNPALSGQEFELRVGIFQHQNVMQTLPSSRYVPISYVFDLD